MAQIEQRMGAEIMYDLILRSVMFNNKVVDMAIAHGAIQKIGKKIPKRGKRSLLQTA